MGGEELRQLASVDANICWAKTGEICRESAVAVLAFGFFSDKILWPFNPLLQNRSLEISVVPTVWLILVSPAFLHSSLWSLHVSALLGWNWGNSFVQCSERLEKLVAHSTLPFLVRGTLSRCGIPSWCWAIMAWGIAWCRQMELFFLFCFAPLFLFFLFRCVA